MHAVQHLSVLSPWQVPMGPTSNKVGMKRAKKKTSEQAGPPEGLFETAAAEPAPASPIRSPALCPKMLAPPSPAKLMRHDAKVAAAKSGRVVLRKQQALVKALKRGVKESDLQNAKLDGLLKASKRKISAPAKKQRSLAMKQVALDIYRMRDRVSTVERDLMGLLEEDHENEMEVRDLEIARLERLVRRLRRPKAPIRK